MEWTCRIDPHAQQDDEVVARTPMIIVQKAQDLQLWPQAMHIDSRDVPHQAEARHQWERACRTCVEHAVQIWLDDMSWDAQDSLQPPWPAGNPMEWDRSTPQAWDQESGALTPEAGAVWWRRPTGRGPWVMAYLADSGHLSTPADIGIALQAACPATAARVRMDESKWWCAWPRTTTTISGADWARRLWTVLGAVRLGTSLVTEPETWENRLKQAINVARTEPGSRVAVLPPEVTETLRQDTLEEMAKIQRLEQQRQAAEQQRQEQEARRQAEQAEVERLAAEKARLVLQKEQRAAEAAARRQAQAEQLQREIEQLQSEQETLTDASTPPEPEPLGPEPRVSAQTEDDALAALQAERDRLQQQVAARKQAQAEQLRQEIATLRTVQEAPQPESVPEESPVPADPGSAGASIPKKEHDSPTEPHADAPSRQPALRRVRTTLAPSHWRPEQPPEWDHRKVIKLPPRKRSVTADASTQSVPADPTPSRPIPGSRQTSDAERRSAATEWLTAGTVDQKLALPWVAWFWGDARKAGTTTAALAFARWLAWVQSTPVRLLEGHLMAPGVARLIQTVTLPLTWGWEGPWTAGKPMCDPRSPIALTDRLTIWALAPHSVTKVVHAENKWAQILQHMVDALIVVDGGLMPPPLPTINLPICVVQRGTHTPDVPSRTWLAYRGVPIRDHQALRLPAEALGAEGVGSAAWAAMWTPLLDVLGLSAAEDIQS